MGEVARTARLIIRTWRDEDVAALAAIGADPDVVRFASGGRLWTEQDAAERIDLYRSIDVSLGGTTWALEEAATGLLVGECGFARTNAEWLRPEVVEIGWLLDRRRWGEGFATEAARVLLPVALAKFERWRIASKCDVANRPSEAVMQRLGLQRAGVVRRAGGDTVVYRLAV